ncbi:MAG TPA: porin [Caulobacteraceae bacterium]|nr:porin [Caulobacteraceae bacterium]
MSAPAASADATSATPTADSSTPTTNSTPAAQPAPASASKPSGLTFDGITVYGTLDIGAAYLSHGAPLTNTYGPGLPYMIQKFSNKSEFSVAPNALSQSKFGVSGVEPIASDVSVVFKLETGFQPTSFETSNGPLSLIKDNGVALDKETESGDSARAGQLFQGAAWAGLASKTFGTLTYGRQNSLILDDLIKYDPQAQSQALSPVGYSGVAGGGGDTEDTRFDSVLKYVVAHGPVRFAYLHQFSSGGSEPGSDQVDIGGDFHGLSVDGVYAHVTGAISASSLTEAQNLLHPGTLDATVSDNTTYSVQAKYVPGQLKQLRLYAAYENIDYANPHTPLASGATSDGGYILSTVNDTAYDHHKVLQIWWLGARYAVTPKLDLAAAYYEYDQNSYKGNGCADSSASSCSGAMNFASAVADQTLTKHFDIYAGVAYSTVANGLASGYLNRSVVSPVTGLRFNF